MKRLHRANLDDVLAELDVMRRIRSPHVVEVIGTTAINGELAVVMGYCPMGSLDKYLRHRFEFISHAGLLQLSCHIAQGLSTVAEHDIIHRDLGSRNVLLDELGAARIADFGLARPLDTDKGFYYSTSLFPVRWAAPEVHIRRRESKASDVYSLACTLYEVFSGGRQPFYDLRSHSQVVLAVAHGQRPLQPLACRASEWRVINCLWAQNPDDRPTAQHAAETFQELLKEELNSSPIVDALYYSSPAAQGSYVELS